MGLGEMKAIEIMRFLEEEYPLSLQSGDDNSGLQIGSPEKDVKRVVVAYEKTLDVISRCVKEKCDMLITHRPLFMPKRFGRPPEVWWNLFKEMIAGNNMVIYSVHENLDMGTNNTGVCLSKELKLTPVDQKEQYLICKTRLVNFGDFVFQVKNRLKPAYIVARGNAKARVGKIGLVAGTAMEPRDIEFFKLAAIDCFLSGDPDDFGIRYAKDLGLMTINVDDYCLERPAIVFLYRLLENKFKELNVEFIDCRYE